MNTATFLLLAEKPAAASWLWFPGYGNRSVAHALTGPGHAVCDNRTWIDAWIRPGFTLAGLPDYASPCARCSTRLPG